MKETHFNLKEIIKRIQNQANNLFRRIYRDLEMLSNKNNKHLMKVHFIRYKNSIHTTI
jgi:hypothetical protein